MAVGAYEIEKLGNEEIFHLIALYQYHLPKHSRTFNFLKVVQKWRALEPQIEYIKIFAPKEYLDSGTFLAIFNFKNCYYVFISAFEVKEPTIDLLLNGAKIDWKRDILFFCIPRDCWSILQTVLQVRNYDRGTLEFGDIFGMAIEDAIALNIDCPTDVYIDHLQENHVDFIRENWAYAFEGAEDYVRLFIRLNGGYGSFLKENNQLVAWIIWNHFGLAMLNTLEEYRRRGFASVLIKAFSKRQAQDGFIPICSINTLNTTSRLLFEKNGFQSWEPIIYLLDDQSAHPPAKS